MVANLELSYIFKAMTFLQTDINSTSITTEAITLKANIEEYFNLATIRQNHIVDGFLQSIDKIEDDKSRLIIESWFKNALNN